MIEVNRLCKYYGAIAAIDDVSFTVGKGEILGFLGPNGAGKSTTMRVLTGFFPATRGTATIAGHEVHTDPLAVKRAVGYLPERVPLYEEMAVHRYLAYVAAVKRVARAQRRVDVARAIARCGLEQHAHRIIGHLSKGYRQRVGLAQALVGTPPVLILDEPTVGLDPAQIIEIREMIRGLAPEHTVLLSTHILPEVAMLCDRAIIINRGRIAADEPIAAAGGEALERRFLEVVSGVGADAA